MSAPLAAQPLVAPATVQPSSTPAAASLPTALLPAGTLVDVVLVQDLSTMTNKTGDVFTIAVAGDVVENGTIVIPKGAIGHGEIVWLGSRGSYGKAGLISFSINELELGDRKVALEGIFREEGKNKNGATAATWFWVGVFSGAIKGKDLVIPKGRVLSVKTRLPISYVPGAAPPPVPNRAVAPAETARAVTTQVIASANPPEPSQPIHEAARPTDTEGKVK